MPRPIALSDRLRIPRFVVSGIGERNRARVHGISGALRHRRNDGAGIYAAGQKRVVQWLDAEPITRKKQRRLVAVIEREREHSAKPRYARFTPGLPRVHDHFRIAPRAERVTEGREL